MAEWTMALVLKTSKPQGFVGSNPTPSAIYLHRSRSLSEINVLKWLIYFQILYKVYSRLKIVSIFT